MNRRLLTWITLGSSLLTIVSIFLLDRPVAAYVSAVDGRSSFVLQQGMHLLEVASGFPISRYLLSFVLLGLAAILFVWRSTRRLAWMFLFVGVTQLAARLLVGSLKEVFGRLRPFQVIADGTWNPLAFFVHGGSFPSGHVAHFWGLFFPLAFLFPRFRIPLLIVPLFVAVARIGVNDHWCSDVLGSIGFSAAVTLLFVWLFRMPQDGTVKHSPGG